MKKYATQGNIKQKNLSDILWYIVQKGKTTRQEIEKGTGFSWGAVSQSVNELILRGYICESEQESNRIGRKTLALKPNGEKIVAIGVDINLTAVETVVLGFDGKAKFIQKEPFSAKTQGEVLSIISACVQKALDFIDGKYKVLGVGLSVQGGVDAERGISYRFTGISDYKSVNLKEIFEEKFSLPVFVEHDPKCMLRAVNIKNDIDNCLLLRIDDGIGMAVMQNGKMLDDNGRLEIGQTIVCFGERLALEDCSSLRGLVKNTGLTKEQILDGFDYEVPTYANACKYMAIALYNAVMLFNPEKIVLTGVLATNKKFFDGVSNAYATLINNNGFAVPQMVEDISAGVGVGLAVFEKIIKLNEI